MTAAQIAKLLTVIHDMTGMSMKQVHLIGFSLGAQVAGLTSHKLIEFGLTRVGKITGLDPTGPMFEGAHPAGRIGESDADFVQAIHGNGASLLQGAFGIAQRVGHRDFYPNGGRFQPGCPHSLLDSTVGSFIDLRLASKRVSCNHFRAIAYVLEAQSSTCRFPSFPCASYEKYLQGECFGNQAVDLDIFAEPVASDKPLYSITNAEETYCANIMRISATATDEQPRGKGSLVFKLNPTKSDAAPSTYTAFEATEFSSGKTFHDIIFGRLRLDDLTSATIEYTRSCRPFVPCGNNDRLALKSLMVEEIGGKSEISCGGLTLSKGRALEMGDGCLVQPRP